MDIVLVHGYNVTSTKTYGVLPQRLKDAGHTIKDVYLSKYVTLDDDIRMSDLVKAFQAALVDIYGANLSAKEFAVITHSTGGLVARDWINTYWSKKPAALPITHLIMLAPPNNGSRLAELGKSRLSRLRNLIGLEPGLKILDALELASDYQWQLNSAWMDKEWVEAPKFFPVVIAGQWIDKKIWDVIVPATYERGSDGVVRAAAANLNMLKLTLEPDGSTETEEIKGVPFLITPKTSHSDTSYGIMGSIPSSGDHPVLTAILQTLDVTTNAQYAALEESFAEQTEALQKTETYWDASRLDRYSQLVFRVTDNLGNKLSDYALELVDESGKGDNLPGGFFADKHQNEVNPELFTYFLDHDKISTIQGERLGFRITVAANTPLIDYAESVYISPDNVDTLLRPNQTTLVDVVMRRRINKNVFRLTTDFSQQPIPKDAGPDWIE